LIRLAWIWPRSLPGYLFYRIRAHDVLICPSGGGAGVAFRERGQDLVVLAGGLGVRT
jgi:hypothetical protein